MGQGSGMSKRKETAKKATDNKAWHKKGIRIALGCVLVPSFIFVAVKPASALEAISVIISVFDNSEASSPVVPADDSKRREEQAQRELEALRKQKAKQLEELRSRGEAEIDARRDEREGEIRDRREEREGQLIEEQQDPAHNAGEVARKRQELQRELANKRRELDKELAAKRQKLEEDIDAARKQLDADLENKESKLAESISEVTPEIPFTLLKNDIYGPQRR